MNNIVHNNVTRAKSSVFIKREREPQHSIGILHVLLAIEGLRRNKKKTQRLENKLNSVVRKDDVFRTEDNHI